MARPERRRRRRLFEPIDALDGQEQHPRDDQEVDHQSDEITPGQDGALLSGVGERGRGHFRRQRDEIVGKIEPAGDGADQRHDNVVDQRIDDRPECGADDDADGKIDDVAAHGEFLEFLEHRSHPRLVECRVQRSRSENSRSRKRASSVDQAGMDHGLAHRRLRLFGRRHHRQAQVAGAFADQRQRIFDRRRTGLDE